jgi:hypothetical protein
VVFRISRSHTYFVHFLCSLQNRKIESLLYMKSNIIFWYKMSYLRCGVIISWFILWSSSWNEILAMIHILYYFTMFCTQDVSQVMYFRVQRFATQVVCGPNDWFSKLMHVFSFSLTNEQNILLKIKLLLIFPTFNTFTVKVDHSQFNNSCLRLPASTLVDIIFQSRSFSLGMKLYSSFSTSS